MNRAKCVTATHEKAQRVYWTAYDFMLRADDRIAAACRFAETTVKAYEPFAMRKLTVAIRLLGGVADGRLTVDVNRGGALAVGLRDSLVVQQIARMGKVAVNKRHVHSMA